MGLSSRRWLILLASIRMALTRECKNPSRIALELKISQFLLGWSARWSRTIIRSFESSAPHWRTTCWTWWSTNIYETFGRKKFAVSCGILFLLVGSPCSETGPNLRTSLFVDLWLSITKLCTEVNISILKQNKSTLWVSGEEISGNELKSESSPFCRTEWFRIHIKCSILSPECLA